MSNSEPQNSCQTRVKLNSELVLSHELRLFNFSWTQTLNWSEKLCSNSWLKSDLKTLNSTQNAIPWLKNCVQNTVFFLNEQSFKNLVLTIFYVCRKTLPKLRKTKSQIFKLCQKLKKLSPKMFSLSENLHLNPSSNKKVWYYPSAFSAQLRTATSQLCGEARACDDTTSSLCVVLNKEIYWKTKLSVF